MAETGYSNAASFSTLAELFTLCKKYGSKTALVEGKKTYSRVISYDDLYGDVIRYSAFLNRNPGKEKKVALIGENSYDWLIAYFSCICSGNIVIPIDKDLSAEDMAELLKNCDCSSVLYSDTYRDVAEKLGALMTGVAFSSLSETYQQSMQIQAEGIESTNADDLAVILFTSGTTGKSKGVMLSQKNLCADLRACCSAVYFYGKTLTLLPFYHAFSIMSVMIGLYYGVEIHICTSLKNLEKAIVSCAPTYLFVVPAFLEVLWKRAVGNGSEQKSARTVKSFLGGALDFVISGGAPLEQNIIEAYEKSGITILNGYGITECSPVVSVNTRTNRRPNSVGQAMPGISVSIMNPDESGKGEICVKGDTVMTGYHLMPSETVKVISDGWFCTGDIGRLDEDGYIYITGRIKNLIILSNGKNVSPEELESKIKKIAGAEEVLVYAKNGHLCPKFATSFKKNN